MKHQKSRKKLNLSSKHRKALIRNQAIFFILQGKLVTTTARIKVVKRFVEKLVTIARKGNLFENRRRVLSEIPYDQKAFDKLFREVAPRYVDRPGGYTRVLRLPRRLSDTACISRLEWVV